MKVPTSNLLLCCFLSFFLPVSNAETRENGSDVLSVFKEHSIVPYLLPSSPKDFCGVIYKPSAIIATGTFYFPYQVEGIPEISWDFQYDKLYTLIVIEAIQKQNFGVTSTTENMHFWGVLEKRLNDNSTILNSSKNITNAKPEDYGSPIDQWWFRWVVVNVEENDIDSGTTLLQPLFSNPTNIFQPNSTHQLVNVFAVFEQSRKFEIEWKNETFFQQLLKTNFTPLANFARDFYGKNSLIYGNFFYVVPKPHFIVDNSPVQKIRMLG